MHFSDEDLIAHLDGELGQPKDDLVRRHLQSCASCRRSAVMLAAEIERAGVALDAWEFPGAQWQADGKRKLSQQFRAFEEGLAAARRRGRFSRPAQMALFAASVMLVAAAVWSFRYRASTLPPAAATIARAVDAEKALYHHPLQQSLSIEITELRPARKQLENHLQIWSDQSTGRFASRLTSADGLVKQALWRPEGNREYVQTTGHAPSLMRRSVMPGVEAAITSIADNGLEPEELEAGFIAWLESRYWNPISLASNLATWAAEDGTLLQVQHLDTAGGSPRVRVTAQRTARHMVAIISMDVDSNGFLPRLQTLRFETPERTVEFRLEASVRPVAASELTAAILYPDLPSAEIAPGTPPIERAQRSYAAPAPAAETMTGSIPDPALDAHYLLHRAGACLGDPMRITEVAGEIQVRRLSGPQDGEPEAFVSTIKLESLLQALSAIRRAPEPVAGLRHFRALATLAEEFPRYPHSSLMDTMVRDHAAGALRQLEQMEEEIDASPSPSAAWPASAVHILDDVERWKQLRTAGESQAAATLAADLRSRLRSLIGGN